MSLRRLSWSVSIKLSVLEAQLLISNLRQSTDEDVQDFFERVSTCVMLSFKESIIDMKEFVGGHVACIDKATKLMCEQIIKRLFISGLWTEIRHCLCPVNVDTVP